MGSLLHLWCNIPRKPIENRPAPDKRRFGLGYQVPPPPHACLVSVGTLPAPCTTQGTAPSKLRSQLFWLLWRCSARFTDGRRNHEKGFNHALQIHWRPQGTYPAASLWLKFYLSSGFFSALLSFLKKHQKTAWPRMGFRGALQGSDSLLALFLWLFLAVLHYAPIHCSRYSGPYGSSFGEVLDGFRLWSCAGGSCTRGCGAYDSSPDLTRGSRSYRGALYSRTFRSFVEPCAIKERKLRRLCVPRLVLSSTLILGVPA